VTTIRASRAGFLKKIELASAPSRILDVRAATVARKIYVSGRGPP
jgi:hypothetical protein